MIERNPFGAWLGLRLLKVDAGGVEIALPWREEFAGMLQGTYMHGGVLAALLDTCGSYAVTARLLKPAPTVDLLVDFHRRSQAGDLTAFGKVVRLGRQLATASIEIVDGGGNLVASGRSKYVSGDLWFERVAEDSSRVVARKETRFDEQDVLRSLVAGEARREVRGQAVAVALAAAAGDDQNRDLTPSAPVASRGTQGIHRLRYDDSNTGFHQTHGRDRSGTSDWWRLYRRVDGGLHCLQDRRGPRPKRNCGAARCRGKRRGCSAQAA